MKRLICALPLIAAMVSQADTPYPIKPEVARQNRAAVEAQAEGAFWKGAPLAVAAVDAMSGFRFLPDVLPEKGDYKGGLKMMLAKGEYEDGAVSLFGFKDLEGVEIVPSDLTGPKGAKLAAADTDVKVVKLWYQQGTAWYGAFASDVERRILTPELLLHDETLVSVDYANRENYLRCDFGGNREYRWISRTSAAVDHHADGEPGYGLIRDAAAPKPFALQKDCFKEVALVFHVPETAAAGLYKGAYDVRVGGKTVCKLPVAVRVLPFALPKPATFRDLNRPFHASGYMYHLCVLEMPDLARNLSAHGLDTTYTFRGVELRNWNGARAAYEISVKYDLNTNLVMCALPAASVTTSFPVEPTNRRYEEYLGRVSDAEFAIKAIREAFGQQVVPFAYAIDEAPPETIRAERATWQAYQKMGARVVASTGYHPYLLFNLDAANIPRQPRNRFRENVNALHAANPDFIASWYGDPHSGPENPDYARRVYGWLTWRNNYDMFSQYIVGRDDWTEFYVWKESFLRGLMLAYPCADGLIDTLAWEGTREAVDDIRYGTLLKQLAEKARKSADIDAQYLGRAALTWVAQVDFERSSLDSLRQEMVEKILALRERVEN